MTNEELSNEFDSFIGNTSITKPFGLDSTVLEFDEYEKSIFLTEAQESIVTSLYNGKLTGDSFENTEELKRYLNNLLKDYSPESANGDTLTEYSHLFKLPKDVLFITYEAIKSNDDNLGCGKNLDIEVIPTSQDELHKIKRNPFRGPNRKRALRLDTNNDTVELIFPYSIDEYKIRYMSRPEPIILTDLPKELSINGRTEETECKLNPAIHRMILEMAINLALKSRSNAGK